MDIPNILSELSSTADCSPITMQGVGKPANRPINLVNGKGVELSTTKDTTTTSTNEQVRLHISVHQAIARITTQKPRSPQSKGNLRPTEALPASHLETCPRSQHINRPNNPRTRIPTRFQQVLRHLGRDPSYCLDYDQPISHPYYTRAAPVPYPESPIDNKAALSISAGRR
jgi:hypothetical protein